MRRRIKGFTAENWKLRLFRHPSEESYYIDNSGIIAVADGVTRDPMLYLSDGLLGKLKFTWKYPIPSPAKKAADLFCKSFVNYFKKHKSAKSVRRAIEYVNEKICNLNKKIKVDYLENDFWACVGVVGIIEGNKLYYGFIADCGVCVFSKNGKLRFRTKNEGPNSKGSISKDIRKKYHTGFDESEGKVIIRSEYRNNPKQPLSYGAFTGEKTALHFLRTGSFKLYKGDYVLFYSDGVAPIIYAKRFNPARYFDNLKEYVDKNLNKIEGTEGTLVVVSL